MTSRLTLQAIALCLSVTTLLWSFIAIYKDKSRHFYVAGAFISSAGVISSASAYFGLSGYALSSAALLSVALSVAGLISLHRANRKPTPGSTA